jgi:hypothetical protein
MCNGTIRTGSRTDATTLENNSGLVTRPPKAEAALCSWRRRRFVPRRSLSGSHLCGRWR